jgi:Flp pilus assembly pilin Flp
MEIDISKQEAWKILDAIVAYKKDYTVTGAVSKTFDNITKKLREIVKD